MCYKRQKPEVWSPLHECVIKIYYPNPGMRNLKKNELMHNKLIAVKYKRQKMVIPEKEKNNIGYWMTPNAN